MTAGHGSNLTVKDIEQSVMRERSRVLEKKQLEMKGRLRKVENSVCANVDR